MCWSRSPVWGLVGTRERLGNIPQPRIYGARKLTQSDQRNTFPLFIRRQSCNRRLVRVNQVGYFGLQITDGSLRPHTAKCVLNESINISLFLLGWILVPLFQKLNSSVRNCFTNVNLITYLYGDGVSVLWVLKKKKNFFIQRNCAKLILSSDKSLTFVKRCKKGNVNAGDTIVHCSVKSRNRKSVKKKVHSAKNEMQFNKRKSRQRFNLWSA